MTDRLTRIASLVLAFGFFISCSSLQPSTQQTSPTPDLSENQIRQQLDSINNKLQTSKQSADLLYRKGDLLTKLAQKQENPTQRNPIYRKAQQTLSEANKLYKDTQQPSTEKVQQLLKITWSNEHNQGVQTLQQDSTQGEPDFERAAAHFNNATTIIPDSAISYRLGAKAMYKNQQPQQAIQILEKARTTIDDVPVMLLEQLAFLYLESNQTPKAVEVYEQAESFSSKNLNLLHGLSNAYISSGDHRKAVELLKRLVDDEPGNVIYGQSLATEFYFLAEQKLGDITTNMREGRAIESTDYSEADSLLAQAEAQFEQTLERNPNDQDLKLSFARFYQNSASKYQQLLPFVKQEKKQPIEKNLKRYVRESIPLLEQVVGQRPDEQRIWQNLYQAYSFLGMEQKAQNAKSNL